MARMDFDSIEQTNGFNSVNPVDDPVYTDYTIAYYAGEKYLRIRMYGQNTRQCKTNASQIIHINKSDAQNLINLMKECFDIFE